MAKDWPGCPGLHSLHSPVTAAHRASVSQPTLAVFSFLAWSLFSLRIRRVVRIDELLPIAPAFLLPPSPFAFAPFSYSSDSLQSNQLLLLLVAGCCCWCLRGATVSDKRRRRRRVQTCTDTRSHPLSLSQPLQFPFALLVPPTFSLFLPPSHPPSYSFSLSLACVSHHHHHRRISWNRSHSQSRSHRMALPSFNSPLPVTTLSSFSSSSSFYSLCACFSCVRVDFVGVWPGFAYFMIYCMFFSSSDLTPLPRPPYHAIAYYTDL